MSLDVNAQELETLEEVLSTSLAGLREEVYKAEVADYKTALQQREAILKALLARVKAART
jgi:hypothetical protein